MQMRVVKPCIAERMLMALLPDAGPLLDAAVNDLMVRYAEAAREAPGCSICFDSWSNILREQLMAVAVILAVHPREVSLDMLRACHASHQACLSLLAPFASSFTLVPAHPYLMPSYLTKTYLCLLDAMELPASR